jgi:hypothetical protein
VSTIVKKAKLVTFTVVLMVDVGYETESPDTGPEGFRFRLQANFVLPKLF